MVIKYDPDAFHRHSSIFVRLIEKKRVKAILKMINIHKEDRVLEVGCGAGNILARLSSGKLFGVDISSFILIKAKEKLNRTAFLFQGDAQNLPCKNSVFSHIICSEVLEHLLDPSVSLLEIRRILAPRGVAVISIPNELWINRIKRFLVSIGIFNRLLRTKGEYREMPEKMENEWHLHTYSLSAWLILFEKSFKVARVKRIPFVWLPLRYVIRLESNWVKKNRS
jgi:ubiquinone/menaquinone biosynthesis C-methylase UbiE